MAKIREDLANINTNSDNDNSIKNLSNDFTENQITRTRGVVEIMEQLRNDIDKTGDTEDYETQKRKKRKPSSDGFMVDFMRNMKENIAEFITARSR